MPDLPPPPPAEPPPAPWQAIGPWWDEQRARAGNVRGLAVLGGVLAALVLGAVAWSAFARPPTTPPELTLPRVGTPGDPSATEATPTSGNDRRPGHATTADAGEDRAMVVAHVAGAVVRPGLYRLAAPARVADAIDAAGGPAADADVDGVNLAAEVGDGERVYLPRRGEVPVAAAGGGGSGSAGRPAALLDLNTATEAELEELPGVGPATAAAIVAHREEHGRFSSVDALLEVRGIGEAKLAAIRPKVRVR